MILDALDVLDVLDVDTPSTTGDPAISLPVSFTVEAGDDTTWYNRRSGAMVGAITAGMAELDAGLVITRLWHRSSTRFTINQSGFSSFTDWRTLHPAAVWQFGASGPTLRMADDVNQIGGSFLTFEITAAQNTFLAAIDTGDEIEITVSEP